MKPLYQIELNTTELCNRTCSFCPRAFDYPNLNLHMSTKTVLAIIQQTKKYTNHFSLAGRGEPLLCKNIYSIIDILIYNNCFVTVVTNGDFLDKHFDSLNKIMNFSVPYSKDVPHNLYKNYKMVVNCYDGQKDDWKKKYGDFPSINWTDARKDTNENFDKMINDSVLTNRGGYLPWKQNKREDALQKPCYQLWWKTFINYNGDVNLCCHDWTHIKNFGNIHETKFEDIWEKGLLDEYRTKLTKWGGRDLFDECRQCDATQNYNIAEKIYDTWK